MKRCPKCGATFETQDVFCEADGARLVGDAAAAPAAAPAAIAPARCVACGEGTIEADGYCSSCGRRASVVASSRPTPPVVPSGAPLAGGVVVASRPGDEHLVRMPGGATLLVALGDPMALDREADAIDRAASAVLPRVVDHGVDPAYGDYLALALPAEGTRPLAEVAPKMETADVLRLLRSLVDAALAVERTGFAWEPWRHDVHVGEDGSVRLSRLRATRRLASGERFDARAVIEAVGPALVPSPAIAGPSRAFRLLLPHVAIPGDAGSTVEDVLREIAAIEREIDLPRDEGGRIGGVCDPGLRRAHNEDACAWANGATRGEAWTVIVVCDGVSSSSNADRASRIASKTACDALAHFARCGDIAYEACAGAVSAAIRAAHVAVCATGIEASGDEPPGTTIVAAIVWRNRLTVGWVGDSRAYWISDHGSELVTRDHSWANEAVARGEMTEDEAMRAPLAHALTRCLGPLEFDESGALSTRHPSRIREIAPDVRARDLPGAGHVVVCSDGFWNYFPHAADVAKLVAAIGAGASPQLVARRLVNCALVRGGQDNTTVVVHEHK